MKHLLWLFVLALMLSSQTVNAQAILVDTSGSMAYSQDGSFDEVYPDRRIDVVSRFLSFAISNWGSGKPPIVLTWSKEPTFVQGSLAELARHFNPFTATPKGATRLGTLMMNEYHWAICEPILVVTDKRPSDVELFEPMLRDYLTATSVAIVIVESSDAAEAYDFYSAQSDAPHYSVIRVGEDSEDDVLLELMAMQSERSKELESRPSCGLNV